MLEAELKASLGDMSVEDALAACEKKCMDILEDYQ